MSDYAGARVSFTYQIGRSPFLKMEKTERVYSLPDTIRWKFFTDALFTKVNIGIRPNNAEQAKALTFFSEGVPQNTLNTVEIPVRETFGDDIAIFPLWMEYINFLVDTKTTNGAHYIDLSPIEFVYSEYIESALRDVQSLQTRAVKRIENGQLYILRDGVRYTVLGTALHE